MSTITLKVEFAGGLELLFDNKRTHSISLPSLVPSDNSIPPASSSSAPESGMGTTKQLDVQYLMFYLRAKVLKERPELFMDGNNVRPGILVLINDTDWELEEEERYQIQQGDEIVFISTLHGG
ncbi:ubiquitin-like modifier 1 [Scleroderma citrinum]